MASNETYQTITGAQVVAASDATGTPTAIIAGMYKAGFSGDPMTLAQQLQKWFQATGSLSWNDALAAYHAQSTTGIQNKGDQSYASGVLQAATNLPHAMIGAMSTSSALTLAALELVAGGVVVAGAAGAAAATGGATAAATLGAEDLGGDVSGAGEDTGGGENSGGGSGSGLGSGLSALEQAAKAAGGAALFALAFEWLTTPSNWVDILKVIGGALAVYFAIKSLAGIDTPNISIDKAAAAGAML